MSEEGKPMRAVGHMRGAIGGGSGISDLDFHRENKKGTKGCKSSSSQLWLE